MGIFREYKHLQARERQKASWKSHCLGGGCSLERNITRVDSKANSEETQMLICHYHLTSNKRITSLITWKKIQNSSRKWNWHYEGQLVAGYQHFQVKPVWHMVNSSTSNRTGTVTMWSAKRTHRVPLHGLKIFLWTCAIKSYSIRHCIC